MALALLLLASFASLACRPYAWAALRYARPPARLVVPVEGVPPAQLTSTWYAPRPGGRRHQGVDIFAPRGTPVRSATHGVVWKVGTDSLGGRVVTVLGEGPALYYYAHLDQWAHGLSPGRTVRPGDALGTVGNTGNARTTPAHLHFGVYRIGLRGVGAVDPVPLLRTRQSQAAP